ncbi:hypothetical protein, partial [Streptomyces sp. UH6]|uniref:hypothetical protein n=1 Tax=Streptomyces sp. UH6 TaxID=2748379 RepID=UPI001C551100
MTTTGMVSSTSSPRLTGRESPRFRFSHLSNLPLRAAMAGPGSPVAESGVVEYFGGAEGFGGRLWQFPVTVRPTSLPAGTDIDIGTRIPRAVARA